MKKSAKKSLTKTLTIKLSVLLIAVLMILYVGSYTVLSFIVHEQAIEYNEGIANVMLDSVCSDASENHEPVDQRYIKELDEFGNYFCKYDFVDFTYAYIISDDMKHLMLLNISERDALDTLEHNPEDAIWEDIDFEPTEQEIALWQGKISSASIENHFLDNTVESLYARYDDFGNRIVVGAGLSMQKIDARLLHNLIPTIIIILAAFVVLTLFIYFIIRRSVLRPTKKLCTYMSAFIENGNLSQVNLDTDDNYEFSLISSSFNKMREDINSYLSNIKRLSSSQERQNAELDIAAKIQQGFLPPHQCYAKDCEIYAMMTPAKNVGGDLYDYLILDDGRVLITIADVSGKGVAASMYMAVTLVIMRQLATQGKSPARILHETNDVVSSHNDYMFFTTAFVGIYDPETRIFTYSNAGHNPPYILRAKPEFIQNAKNIVLGLYKNEPYTEESISLNYGDIIFLYTDGITEATDENNRFFGEEKLTGILSDFRTEHAENIVEYVNRATKAFTGNAEQHDDMTMLSLTVKNLSTLNLSPDTHEFSEIKQVIMDSQLPQQLRLTLCVAAEEIFINICSYAFSEKTSEEEKKIKFEFEHSDRIIMRFEDNGTKYDPTDNMQLDVDYDMDTQFGGLGKIIAFTIADKINYEYTDNNNILTIIKYLNWEEEQ